MGEAPAIVRNWRSVLVLGALLAWMLLDEAGVARALSAVFPAESPVLHARHSLAEMFAQHVAITAMASGLAIVIGGTLGLLLLTGAGRELRELVENLTSLGQVLPTVAVIALMVPLIGYGTETVVVALAVYSVLPVMVAVVAGVGSVSPSVVDAATGMGMDARQRFFRIQAPLAAPVIVGGIKNMMIINVSAAAMGAIVGAGGFGLSIFAGIAQFNYALVIAGALPTVLMALIIDRSL
ncbi:MAG: ABC transporter permease [Actinobacteria bacterium]|nr:ABC transporter permease [Actinomycetota bacterium]